VTVYIVNGQHAHTTLEGAKASVPSCRIPWKAHGGIWTREPGHRWYAFPPEREIRAAVIVEAEVQA
jgi:hypothetical protein